MLKKLRLGVQEEIGMLQAHPATLKNLVQDYERLAALVEEAGGDLYRRRDDAAYTLCVSTGTRDIRSALATAREQLSSPAPPSCQLPGPEGPLGGFTTAVGSTVPFRGGEN